MGRHHLRPRSRFGRLALCGECRSAGESAPETPASNTAVSPSSLRRPDWVVTPLTLRRPRNCLALYRSCRSAQAREGPSRRRRRCHLRRLLVERTSSSRTRFAAAALRRRAFKGRAYRCRHNVVRDSSADESQALNLNALEFLFVVPFQAGLGLACGMQRRSGCPRAGLGRRRLRFELETSSLRSHTHELESNNVQVEA